MPFYQSDYLKHKELYRSFVVEEILNQATQFDKSESIPRDFFYKLAKQEILGAAISKKWGGVESNYITLGLMHEELGRGLCSIQNIVTVCGMVCRPLLRFGTMEQKNNYLGKIARGEMIVALALTEPDVGSDLQCVETRIVDDGNAYLVTGIKSYITLGQIADLFLVLAKLDNKPIALFIEKETPGVTIVPIKDILGMRANMLAEIHFENCRVPQKNQLGSVGMGWTHVMQIALDEGRFTTAFGCVGLGQACLDAVLEYTNKRKQFGSLIKDHPLVQKMMTEMIVDIKASRALCHRAAVSRENGDFNFMTETLVAKYAASKMAVRVANHALQIFAAAGFTTNYPVERYYRDAKAMEIIEGTSQMYEMHIPQAYITD